MKELVEEIDAAFHVDWELPISSDTFTITRDLGLKQKSAFRSGSALGEQEQLKRRLFLAGYGR